MAANYPPMDQPMPQIYSHEHVKEWEEQLRNLAVADAVIKKCERCKIPVQTSRTECDSLCEFFQAMIEEERGQQATRPHPI